jgi:hypothetical protein
MAPLDGGMLEAFRVAKDRELSKRRVTLSKLIDEIKISVQNNTAYIQLAEGITRPEKHTLVDLLNEKLGGLYAYADPRIDRLLINIDQPMLVRINAYARANNLGQLEAARELIELGLASTGRF